MRRVCAIYRYPIKGLSPQPLTDVALEAGKPFPFDRVFALVRPGAGVDAGAPTWAKKGAFLMLMLEEGLAQVRSELDVESLQLEVFEPRGASSGPRQQPLLSANLGTEKGRAAVEAFFQRQLPKLKSAPRLVRARDGHFMDKPDNVISCINLATVRSLQARWQTNVHPLRFRANFYIDGLRPWQEFDWLGSEIRLGEVSFRVDRRNGRCGATNVNPLNGARDMDIPGELRKQFGHKDLGIYLVALSSGHVALGDAVAAPDVERASTPPSAPTVLAPDSFICRGCYYVLDLARGAPGVPAGTLFAAIAPDFRCPDCGTDKSNFRAARADSAG
ncbi:MAG: MOSC domain-containing protein [Polyangiaceae bacterium]